MNCENQSQVITKGEDNGYSEDRVKIDHNNNREDKDYRREDNSDDESKEDIIGLNEHSVVHYSNSSPESVVSAGTGGLWWPQNQTPVVSQAYDLSGNGVIISKSSRMNGSANHNIINYDDWYGSQVNANNVIQMSTTPTTIATAGSPNAQHINDSYLSFGQNQSHNSFDSQQQQQQVVIRSTGGQSLPTHRRSNSGSEGGIHENLFSPTEGRECVNCGKH